MVLVYHFFVCNWHIFNRCVVLQGMVPIVLEIAIMFNILGEEKFVELGPLSCIKARYYFFDFQAVQQNNLMRARVESIKKETQELAVVSEAAQKVIVYFIYSEGVIRFC